MADDAGGRVGGDDAVILAARGGEVREEDGIGAVNSRGVGGGGGTKIVAGSAAPGSATANAGAVGAPSATAVGGDFNSEIDLRGNVAHEGAILVKTKSGHGGLRGGLRPGLALVGAANVDVLEGGGQNRWRSGGEGDREGAVDRALDGLDGVVQGGAIKVAIGGGASLVAGSATAAASATIAGAVGRGGGDAGVGLGEREGGGAGHIGDVVVVLVISDGGVGARGGEGDGGGAGYAQRGGDDGIDGDGQSSRGVGAVATGQVVMATAAVGGGEGADEVTKAIGGAQTVANRIGKSGAVARVATVTRVRRHRVVGGVELLDEEQLLGIDGDIAVAIATGLIVPTASVTDDQVITARGRRRGKGGARGLRENRRGSALDVTDHIGEDLTDGGAHQGKNQNGGDSDQGDDEGNLDKVLTTPARRGMEH